MITKEALDALSLADAIRAANVLPYRGAIILPKDYAAHDLEKFGVARRRARGSMTTNAVTDFARYVKAHAAEGATVFVAQATMQAVAVLNLGTAEEPGHADDTATLKAEATAAYAALVKAAAQPLTQRDFAEFLEDWAPQIECEDQSECAVQVKHAVDAVRRVTIEAARKVETADGKLSAERSAFESVKARSDGGALPTMLRFSCEPYKGLLPRIFAVRVGIRTGGDAPAFVLRMIKAEEHAEQMAQDFAQLIAAADLGEGVPVLLGTYSAKP